jgi:hypothetical protein
MSEPGIALALLAMGSSSFYDCSVSREGLLEVGVHLKAVSALEGTEIDK